MKEHFWKLTAGVVISLSAVFTNAAPVVDQVFFEPSGTQGFGVSQGNLRRVQSFTSGATGLLSRLDVFGVTFGPLTVTDVRIVDIVNGLPGDTLAQLQLVTPIASATSEVNIDLTALDFHMTAGTAYGFELIGSGFMRGNQSGGYAGGSNFFINPLLGPNWLVLGGDTYFRTYVDTDPGSSNSVSLPATLGLVLLGFGLMHASTVRVRTRLQGEVTDAA